MRRIEPSTIDGRRQKGKVKVKRSLKSKTKKTSRIMSICGIDKRESEGERKAEKNTKIFFVFDGQTIGMACERNEK